MPFITSTAGVKRSGLLIEGLGGVGEIEAAQAKSRHPCCLTAPWATVEVVVSPAQPGRVVASSVGSLGLAERLASGMVPGGQDQETHEHETPDGPANSAARLLSTHRC